MENNTRRIAVLLLAAMIVTSGFVQTTPRSKGLQGVWKAAESGAGQNTSPLLGLAIFTDTHYSMMYFSAVTERPDIVDVSMASADDMRALWAGWAAHTGSYETNG